MPFAGGEQHPGTSAAGGDSRGPKSSLDGETAGQLEGWDVLSRSVA